MKTLYLEVNQADDNIYYDHADWTNLKIIVNEMLPESKRIVSMERNIRFDVYSAEKPESKRIVSMEPYILTPKSGPEPKIK